MLEDQNNTMIFLWEIYSIFMQTSSIVLVLQHGRRAHTLYNPIKMGLGGGGEGRVDSVRVGHGLLKGLRRS